MRNKLQQEKQPSLKGKKITFILILLLALCTMQTPLYGAGPVTVGGHGSLKGNEIGFGLIAMLPIFMLMNQTIVVAAFINAEMLFWSGGYVIPIMKSALINDNSGGGHDNLLTAGLRLTTNKDKKPYYLGGDIGIVRDVSIYKSGGWDPNPSAWGFSIGVVGGYKLPVDAVDMHLFSSLSLVNFGDFKSGGDFVEEGHGKIKFQLGLEVALPFGKN